MLLLPLYGFINYRYTSKQITMTSKRNYSMSWHIMLLQLYDDDDHNNNNNNNNNKLCLVSALLKKGGLEPSPDHVRLK